jgi:hypothetical protein
MNNKILVATIATVVAIASGIYFYSKSNTKVELAEKPSIVGLWTVDSSKFESNNLLSSIISKEDSISKFTLNFGVDSLLSNNLDSLKLKYNLTNDSLYVTSNNAVSNFGVTWISDSSVVLKNDSTTTVFLSKK